MNDTPTLDLDALEAAARAATPGPWEVLGNGDTVWSEDNLGGICVAALGDYPDRDAAFIAAADPSTVLALIARLRDAEARIERVERLCQKRERGPAFQGDYYLQTSAVRHTLGSPADTGVDVTEPRPASREERQQFAELVARERYGYTDGGSIGGSMWTTVNLLDGIARAVPGSILVSALLGNDHADCETCSGNPERYGYFIRRDGTKTNTWTCPAAGRPIVWTADTGDDHTDCQTCQGAGFVCYENYNVAAHTPCFVHDCPHGRRPCPAGRPIVWSAP